MTDRWPQDVGGWRRRPLTALLALLLTALAASCSGTGQPASRLEPVKFCTDWPTPWTEWVVWEYAQESGLFQRHGIRVNIQKPVMPQEALKMVATGWCDVGYGYMLDMLRERERFGAPIKAVGSLFPENRWGVAWYADPARPGKAGLAGRDIAVYNLTTDQTLWRYWLQVKGVTMGEVHGVEGSIFSTEPLFKGAVTAIGAWEDAEMPLMQVRAPEAQVLFEPAMDDVSRQPYLTLLVTNESFTRRYPGLLRSFLLALNQSLDQCRHNPEAALALFLGRHPEFDQETREWFVQAWAGMAKSTHPRGGINPYRWRTSLETLVKAGVIPGSYLAEGAYTNAFVPVEEGGD